MPKRVKRLRPSARYKYSELLDYAHISAQGFVSKKYLFDKGDYDDRQRNGRRYQYTRYELFGLDIMDYGPHVEIKGSIHKFYNLITVCFANNHTNFTYNQVCQSIDMLSHLLDIPANKMLLMGYEFALNLKTSFKPKTVIEKNIVCHRLNCFPVVRDYKTKGHSMAYQFDGKILKIYDKGSQEQLSCHLLRIEHKYTKSKLNRTKIEYLSDFKNIEVWPFMLKKLIDSIDSLIVLDKPQLDEAISNPKYWQQLRLTSREKNDRRLFKREFDRLPSSSIKDEMIHVAKTAFTHLKCHESILFSTSELIEKVSRFHIIYVWNRDTSGRCPVTGFDITHQRKGSKFLSEKTILSLDQSQFDELEDKYLPIKAKFLKKDIKAYRIAHNIRNKVHNALSSAHYCNHTSKIKIENIRKKAM